MPIRVAGSFALNIGGVAYITIVIGWYVKVTSDLAICVIVGCAISVAMMVLCRFNHVNTW